MGKITYEYKKRFLFLQVIIILFYYIYKKRKVIFITFLFNFLNPEDPDSDYFPTPMSPQGLYQVSGVGD